MPIYDSDPVMVPGLAGQRESREARVMKPPSDPDSFIGEIAMAFSFAWRSLWIGAQLFNADRISE
jgi:hypothetical protein